MSITDKDGKWKIETRHGVSTIIDCKTNKVRVLNNHPSATNIATMSYKEYIQRCETAFSTGTF